MRKNKTAKEPAWIIACRRSIKKSHLNPGEGLDAYERSFLPLDIEQIPSIIEPFIAFSLAKGAIRPKDTAGLSKSIRHFDGLLNDEIPEYEDPIVYAYLKSLSEKLEKAVPRLFRNKKTKKRITLPHSPVIITARRCGLNASTGRLDNNNEGYHYIIVDTLFFSFINLLGEDVSCLLNMGDEDTSDHYLANIKKMPDINLERNPDIYKRLRTGFFHYMFYWNNNFTDPNLVKMIRNELQTNFLFNTKSLLGMMAIVDLSDVIRDSIGLFIMAHEYAHIIFYDEYENHSVYPDTVERSWFIEECADFIAFQLMWDCMRREIDQSVSETVKSVFCLVSIEIALNCLLVIDRMRGAIMGIKGVIASEDHPPTRWRMERMRKTIQDTWKEWNIGINKEDYLDAVDSFFQKLGDRFVAEVENDNYFKEYLKTRNETRERLAMELFELIENKSKLPETVITEDDIKEVYKKGEETLSEDPNNVDILFALGKFLFNWNEKQAVRYFSRIVIIYRGDTMKTYVPDQPHCAASFFYIGIHYLNKITKIIQKSKGSLNSAQKEEVNILSDEAIKQLTTAIPYYSDRQGMEYYYLGMAYCFNGNYLKALENFDIALRYHPDNEEVLFARDHLIGMIHSRPVSAK